MSKSLYGVLGVIVAAASLAGGFYAGHFFPGD